MSAANDFNYSLDARATEYYFLKEFNDMNIFVEDENKEYEYETIFKRLLKEKYNIVKIFAVGGKERVKEAFEEFGEYDNFNNEIKNIYIVDGDFDRYIYRNEMIKHPNFIYLESYNIENYFIDKIACQRFAKGLLKCKDCDVENKVDFLNWRESIVEQASRLFFCYCYVKKYHPSKKSVSRSPYLFLDDKTGFEKQGAYEKYKQEVILLNENAFEEIEKIKLIYYSINNDCFNIICGKFLLDSLYCHIRKITKEKFKKDQFRWYLLDNFDISSLNYIKDKILNIVYR